MVENVFAFNKERQLDFKWNSSAAKAHCNKNDSGGSIVEGFQLLQVLAWARTRSSTQI